MIRSVLFDIGNVLLFFSHEQMCNQVAHLCGIDNRLVWELFMEKGLGCDYETGRLSSKELKNFISKFATKSFTMDDLLWAVGDIFVLNESMVPVVENLKKNGVRLVLLSNISEAHLKHIDAQFSLLSLFDAAAFSCKVGAMKPDRAIFDAAVTAAQCAPEECFYTDDIPKFVQAARNLHIDAETFTSSENLILQLKERGLGIYE